MNFNLASIHFMIFSGLNFLCSLSNNLFISDTIKMRKVDRKSKVVPNSQLVRNYCNLINV